MAGCGKTNPLAPDLDHILDHTRDLWNEMRGKRIFITGGTGFFGSWLLESFVWVNRALALRASIVVLTRSPEQFRWKSPHLANDPCVRLIAGDVRDFQFPDEEFSFLIHAATEASVQQAREAPLEMLDVIVSGTRRTLEFARCSGVRKVLLTSSGAVYGKQPAELAHMPEDYIGGPDPLNPSSVYGEGKRTAELLCALYASKYGFECKIARCFAFVGPYLPLNTHFAVGNFIRDAMAGEPIRIRSDGTPYRSYLYASDLAVWLWTILFRGESCRPCNVGSEDGIRIAHLAKMVAEVLGPGVPVRFTQPQSTAEPQARYVPSTKRAQLELGVKQRVTLADSIRRTAAWYGLVSRQVAR